MRRTGPLLLVAALISYGSLYPFHLAWPPSLEHALEELFSHPDWWTSLSDVAGNVLLFVPMGVAIVVATDGRTNAGAWRAMWIVLSLALALLLQVAQVFVPSRSAAMADVLWNGVGLGIGLVLGKAARALMQRLAIGGDRLAAMSALVLAFWGGWRLWPFVPTIDFQHFKDSLKPLLLQPEFNGWSFASMAVSVALLSALVVSLRYPKTILVGVTAASIAARPFLVGQTVSVSVVAGSVVGLLLGLGALRMGMQRALPLLILLAMLWFTADSLRPFEFSAVPGPMNWTPFASMLDGSMDNNLAALCGVAFITGALAIMGRRMHMRGGGWTIAVVTWLIVLEVTQTWLPARTADLTVALFPIGWWLGLRSRRGGNGATSPSRRRAVQAGSRHLI
jgi:VanZ family protein